MSQSSVTVEDVQVAEKEGSNLEEDKIEAQESIKTQDSDYGYVVRMDDFDEEEGKATGEDAPGVTKSAATWYSDEASIFSSSIDTIPKRGEPLLLEDEDGLYMCFKTIEMSNSQFGTHPLFNFPNYDDPGIATALEDIIPEKEEDPGGVKRYIELCRKYGCTCISSMRKALLSDFINLRYYSMSPLSLRALCIVLESNRFVHKIDFSDTHFTVDMCLQISNMLYENNVVQEINFTSCRMGPDGMDALSKSIGASMCLTTLLLRNNNIGDAGMVSLCDALVVEENNSLEVCTERIRFQYLDVGYNHLGEASGLAMQTWFLATTCLTHLQLAWNDLNSETCIAPFIKGLMKNKSIEFLGMAWNGISGSFFSKGITKYIKRSRRLRELDISYNNILGVDCIRIMKAIKKSKSLRKFYIGGNPIYEEHAGPFAAGVMDVKGPLEYVGMQHLWIPLQAKLAMDKSQMNGSTVVVEYEGILHNYVIEDPDRKIQAIRRVNFVAEPPKKKPPKKPPKKVKKRVSHLMLELIEEKIGSYSKELFLERLQKLKLKKLYADTNLLNYWLDLYPDIKSTAKFNCRDLAQEYFNMFPTEPYPPPPPKPEKKGKKEKGGKGAKKNEPAPPPGEGAPPADGAPPAEGTAPVEGESQPPSPPPEGSCPLA